MNVLLTTVVLSVAIIVPAIAYGMKKGSELRAQGKIVTREAGFYEREFVYATPVFDFGALAAVVRRIDFADAGAGVGWKINASRQMILFTNSSEGFEAQLKALPDYMGEHQFRFCFTHWRTHKGLVHGLTQMNSLMTAFEKGMLGLDPYVTVSSKLGQIKSKVDML